MTRLVSAEPRRPLQRLDRTLLRLATAGSVDDGKSTLVGRLLHDTKSVLADQLDAVERVSARPRPRHGADLALLTDGLRAEREQGITIDVAYRYFATRDAARSSSPTAPATCSTPATPSPARRPPTLVVLLVDARNGVVEQTRRHLAVTALLRVPHVVVAVNKIDLVDFDAGSLRRGRRRVRAPSPRELGIPRRRTPSRCRRSTATTSSTASARTPWYAGPTLLELLEALPAPTSSTRRASRSGSPSSSSSGRRAGCRPARPTDRALRDYRGYAGRCRSGVVRVGDGVSVLPSGSTRS